MAARRRDRVRRGVGEDRDIIVWISRFQHEQITSDYNSRDKADLAGRVRRKMVNGMNFDAQREAGLAKLRELGILK